MTGDGKEATTIMVSITPLENQKLRKQENKKTRAKISNGKVKRVEERFTELRFEKLVKREAEKITPKATRKI